LQSPLCPESIKPSNPECPFLERGTFEREGKAIALNERDLKRLLSEYVFYFMRTGVTSDLRSKHQLAGHALQRRVRMISWRLAGLHRRYCWAA